MLPTAQPSLPVLEPLNANSRLRSGCPVRYKYAGHGHSVAAGADVAQLVELQISNLNVASSNLVVRSNPFPSC